MWHTFDTTSAVTANGRAKQETDFNIDELMDSLL